MDTGKCFIYCRQSSGQEDSENSISIQQQLQNCLDLAKKRELEVVGVFTDANVSGKTYPKGERFEKIADSDPGFNQWFQEQKSTKRFREGLGEMFNRLSEVEYILVDEVTRLHRSTAKSFLEQTLTYEITKAKIKIIQVKGDTIDLSKFDQNLIHMLRTQINDEQIANQKKKSIESRLRIKDSGILSNIKFFGAVYEGNKKFHFDPGQAEVIRFVFRSLLNGMTYSQIYYEVNRLFPDRLGKAKMFYETSLSHIATQPAYAGYMYNSEGELIPCGNAPEPLISIRDFERVQELMEHKKKRHKRVKSDQFRRRTLPFTGFLKCGHCGGNLIVITDQGKISYKCKGAVLRRSEKCRESRVLVAYEDKSENCGLQDSIAPLLVLSYLERYKKCESLRDGSVNIARLQKEEKELRQKIKVAFDLFCSNVLDEEAYKEVTRERMDDVKRLHREAKEIEWNSDMDPNSLEQELESDFRYFLANYKNLPESLYEELLRHSIREIYTYKTHIHIETFYGNLDLPRFEKDRRQNNVFPEGSLIINKSKDKSLFEKETEIIIQYDYKTKYNKNGSYLEELKSMNNIKIFKTY